VIETVKRKVEREERKRGKEEDREKRNRKGKAEE
jgi:hypothetical protein